ncbi:hypothetical protein [Maribellus luteus]|nr:hypothetical protein [Maribellus luteus]
MFHNEHANDPEELENPVGISEYKTVPEEVRQRYESIQNKISKETAGLE